jgi:hypothetical protein
MRLCTSYPYTSRKPMIQLGGKYCTIFLDFGVHVKLVRLIKTCLNGTCISKHLSRTFSIQNGLKQGGGTR